MSLAQSVISALLATERLPYPKVVSIEPVANLCQLRCPLCPVGARALDQPPRFMSLETFKTLVNKMPFVRVMDLYKSGEPFFNPDIFAMIRYAADRKIKVAISTNLSFERPDSFFEELVRSGLDSLVVSLDGASQESYSRYRVGGDYRLVLSNLEKLIETKKRLGGSSPSIAWQFLVNRFNEPEIEAARGIAARLGIALELRPISLADNEPDVREHPETIEERKRHWLPENREYVSDCYQGEYRYPLSVGICTQLFTRAVLTVDGKALPCCEVWNDSSSFGDLLNRSFDEVWYGASYLDARARFLEKGHRSQVPTICSRCNNFGASPSLKEKLALLLHVYRKDLGHRLRSLL